MKSEVMNIDPHELLEHTAWMSRLARRLVLGADRVDDLVQDAWTAALTHPPSDKVPLRAWLTSVMKKRALFTRRSEGRLKARENRTAADSQADRAIPSAAELSERVELQRNLLEHVNELPEKYREVILLRYFEAMGPAAIAKHLNLPVNSVSTLLQRGLERMRVRFDEENSGDRRAWNLALMPLALLDRSTLKQTSTATGSSITTALAPALLKAIVAAVLILSVSLGVWQHYAHSVPDLRQFTTGVEAADVLFATHLVDPVEASSERVPEQRLGRMIHGLVVDQDGNPIPGAQLHQVRPPGWAAKRRATGSYTSSQMWVKSASDGSFAGPLALMGRLHDAEGLPWLMARHGDFISIARTQVPSDDSAVILRMARLQKTTLEVEVIDASSGRTVPRFHLFTNINAPEAFEEDAREWPKSRTEVLDYKSDLEVSFAEGMLLNVELDVLEMQIGFNAERIAKVVKPVRDGRTVVRFEVELDLPEQQPGASLAFGRVIDELTGEPIAGAEIWVHPLLGATVDENGRPRISYGHQERRVMSFEDGRFRIAMEEGGPEAIFAVHHPLYQDSPGYGELSGPRTGFDGVHECEIKLRRRGSIRGLVVDGAGQPMVGVPLLCVGDTPSKRLSTFQLHASEYWRMTTDDTGHFELQGLNDYRYSVFVLRSPQDPDEAAITSASYVLDRGEQLEVVLQVDAPDRVTVRGRVVSPTPIDYELVPMFIPYADGAGWVRPKSSARGYKAGGLTRGLYLVMLAPAIDDHHGPFALVPEVSIEAFGDQVMNFAYPTGSLEGHVEWKDPNAKLRVAAVPILPEGLAHDFVSSGKVTRLLSVPVEASGDFKLTMLPLGPHRLKLFANSGLTEIPILASQEVLVTGRTRLTPWRP